MMTEPAGRQGVRIGFLLWPQTADWPAIRDAAVRAERAGAASLWTWDHLNSIVGPWEGPILEGWSVLAGWSQVTSRVTLGLMVGANTFRNPGLTAKLATTLDHLSDGRAILGVGAGWFAREHEAFGIEFGAGLGERLDRLGEAVPLVRRLLDGERVTHEGRWYSFSDAICAPLPVQARLPILVGGSGPRKTLPLVARHADMWNAYGSPEELAASDSILRRACEAAGRDDREIERTFNGNVVIRASREAAELAWRGWLERHRPQAGEDRLNAFGTVADVAEELDRYRDVGFGHPVLIFRSPFDLETMDRLPDLRAALGD